MGRLRIQRCAGRVVLVDGVVPGGDAAGADGARGLEQLVELEVVVAERARDRRASGEVLADEGPHNVLLEALFLVDDVVGDAEVLGDASCVVDIVERAAAAGLGSVGYPVLAGEARLIPELQGQPDDALRRRSRRWARIAATVEESTPPDMATAMVSCWHTSSGKLYGVNFVRESQSPFMPTQVAS